MSDLAALILAAGSSTRLGQPKQLLVYQGRSLLRRAVEAALTAECLPVCVVVGSNADRMIEALRDLPVRIAINAEWSRGIGSSIRAGAAKLLGAEPTLSRLILMLCDQPHVTAGTLTRLIRQQHESGRPVCVSRFSGTVGPPVLIGQPILPMLLDLPDASGAKAIWESHPDLLSYLDCPEASVDIDRLEDWERLSKGEN